MVEEGREEYGLKEGKVKNDKVEGISSAVCSLSAHLCHFDP